MGGKSLWAEKAYGRKKPMGGKSLWAEKAYGQKKPMGGIYKCRPCLRINSVHHRTFF